MHDTKAKFIAAYKAYSHAADEMVRLRDEKDAAIRAWREAEREFDRTREAFNDATAAHAAALTGK